MSAMVPDREARGVVSGEGEVGVGAWVGIEGAMATTEAAAAGVLAEVGGAVEASEALRPASRAAHRPASIPRVVNARGNPGVFWV